MRKFDVAQFKGVTLAKPANGMSSKDLSALRVQIGDKSHRPLNALRDTAFHVCGTCPKQGVQVNYAGRAVWVSALLLQPVPQPA